MAKTKDLNEVYLCETDADRESIVPYAGQKCIMQNGDIYICVRNGVWGKVGTTPTTYTVTFKIEDTTYDTVTCIEGLSVDAPADPEQIGATFDGWKDSNDNIISFPYTPSADTTLTAVFIPVVPPVTDYNIPLEIPLDWYADAEGTLFFSKEPHISNFVLGNTYKLSMYDNNNNVYSVTATAEAYPDIQDATICLFKFTDLPSGIADLIYGYDGKDIPIGNNILFDLDTGNFIGGNGFVSYISLNEGYTLQDLEAVIDKFKLEEA
jgi:hypothetical protein